MELEPDWVFCKRLLDIDRLGLVLLRESSDELLSDRKALVNIRGFLVSPASWPSARGS